MSAHDIAISKSEGDDGIYHVQRENREFVGWIVVDNGVSGFNQESDSDTLSVAELLAIANFMHKLNLSLTK